MEQEIKQNLIQQAQQKPPEKCPRCNSLDTKFRYFNNQNLSQPRHYCRNCKRLWTVGGSLREVPVGGNSRNRPNRRNGSEASAQPQPPLFPSMVPQNIDVSWIQSATNMPQPIAPRSSYYFTTNRLPNVDPMDSLIHPDVVNQTANVGGPNRSFLQDWNIQSVAEPRALPQPNRVNPVVVDLNQPQVQIDSYPVSMYGLIRPDWPMNPTPRETMNNFSGSTSDAWGNSSGNTTNKPTTSANPSGWWSFKAKDNHKRFF